MGKGDRWWGSRSGRERRVAERTAIHRTFARLVRMAPLNRYHRAPMNQHASTPARLALASGAVFHGTGFGASSVQGTGEVVFNTAMCGYQEALSDPSYTGQILVMTAPQIGNYGVAADDVESGKPCVTGFVVR